MQIYQDWNIKSNTMNLILKGNSDYVSTLLNKDVPW